MGVLDGGDRPPELAQLPSVGRYGQLDLERLLSLKPDLILLWPASVPPAQRAQLERLGIAMVSAEPHDLDSLVTQIADIGDLGDQAVEVMGFGADHRDAEALQLGALGRRHAGGPEQDQVGLETEQAFQVELSVAPHGRQLRQFRRPVAAIKHAHQQICLLYTSPSPRDS